MDYKSKYLKYKNKYLELKNSLNQKGAGGDLPSNGMSNSSVDENIDVEIVWITGESKTFSNIYKNLTIRNIKNMIKNAYPEIANKNIMLIFNDTELVDNSLTLNDLYSQKIEQEKTLNSASNDSNDRKLEFNVIVGDINDYTPPTESISLFGLQDIIRFIRENKAQHKDMNKIELIIDIGNHDTDSTNKVFRELFSVVDDLKYLEIISATEILPGVIPNTLIKLKLLEKYRHDIVPGVLPPDLQILIYNENKFNKNIGPNVLPEGLVELTLGNSFNQQIGPNVLPGGLQNLTFGTDFNKSISPDVLPKGLQNLTFGAGFDQTISPTVLPPGLHSLTFGFSFNKPIGKDVLPVGLQNLTFGVNINQLIGNDVLPVGLQNLSRFNQTIDPDVLPAGLHSLSLNDGYSRSIAPDVLPNGLKVLRIPSTVDNTEELKTICKTRNIQLFINGQEHQ